MSPIITRIRSAAMTYPQVLSPRLAGALVRAITSGSSSPTNGSDLHRQVKVYKARGLGVGKKGEPYTPQWPDSGRTNGILAAQAAAAPAAPAMSPNEQIIDVDADAS